MSTESTTNNFKTNLMTVLVNFIRQKGWTQKVTANLLSVSQPRVSDLMNEKIDKFSTDMLLGMLQKVGYYVDIKFDEANQKHPLDMSIKCVSLKE